MLLIFFGTDKLSNMPGISVRRYEDETPGREEVEKAAVARDERSAGEEVRAGRGL